MIALAGPTASGKTSLGVLLAKELDGEIISADSMQIYKGMPIATAQPTEEELGGVRCHLTAFLSPENNYSAADFVRDAKNCAEDIISRGKIPIIVGGTGLYLDSFLTNTTFFSEPDTTGLREELRQELEAVGAKEMHRRLAEIDPEAAASIHPNNTVRVLRALEVYLATGETITQRKKRSREGESEYDALYLALNYKNREILYERINKRVDMMLSDGLLDEAEKYFSMPGRATASQAIGYKELAPYFEGTSTLEECVENLKRATRHYAKRQLTWFKKNESIIWLYPDEDEGFSRTALDLAKEFLQKEG